MDQVKFVEDNLWKCDMVYSGILISIYFEVAYKIML